MEIGTASLITRAIWNTGLTLADAAGFALTWTAADLSDATRRELAFLAAILFVVFFHEAQRWWRHLGEARGKAGPASHA